MRKIIFLDRDGTINKDRKSFVKTWEEFEFVPGIIDSIKKLNKDGFEIIIITNQSGVARGLYTENDLNEIHRKMLKQVEKGGGKILDIFYCLHHPEGKVKKYRKICSCRKPEPGLILKAAKKYNIDLSKSWMIGDKEEDIEAGRRAGCKTIKIKRDRGIKNIIKNITQNNMKNTFKQHIKNILKKCLPFFLWKRLRSFYWHIDGYITIKKRVKHQKQEDYKKRRLLAIYDFTNYPFSHDITTFLINAELHKRKRGLDKIDVVFMAHASDPGPSGCNTYVNKDNFRHYLYNLAIEMTRLFDSIGNIFVFDNRRLFIDFFSKFKSEYFILPEDYSPLMSAVNKFNRRPRAYLWINSAEAAKRDSTLLCLTPPKEQINIVRKWILKNIYPNIPITITLREWGYLSWKNSNIPEWQKLIDSYKDIINIKFIVLRDYYKIYDDPVLSGQNVIYYNEPLVALSLRAALYQECALNLLCVGGCMTISGLNRKSRYIVFRLPANPPDLSVKDAKKHIWGEQGLRPGEDFQGSTKYQKYIWEPDTFEVMKPEVDKMIRILKGDGLWTPKYYEK